MDVGLDESIENNEIDIIEDENDNDENNFLLKLRKMKVKVRTYC